MSTPRIRRPGSLLVTGLLLLTILVFGAPVLWTFVSALGDSSGVSWRPGTWTLDRYRELSDDVDLAAALQNSLVVAVGSTAVSTVVASLGGFALSRSHWRFRELVMYGLVLLYAIPLAATMVAMHDLAGRLELIDTWRGIILAQAAIATPFLTWLLKGFYDDVSRSLDDAAALDGASTFRIWWQVLTPLVWPGLLVGAALSFVLAWSDVLLPVIFIMDPAMNTVAREFFSLANTESGAQVSALGVVYLTPVLVVLLLMRRLIQAKVTSPLDEE